MREQMHSREGQAKALKSAVREGDDEEVKRLEPVMPLSNVATEQFAYIKYSASKYR